MYKDPELRQESLTAYKDHFTVPRIVTYKFAVDKRRPNFVDPCADEIQEIFEAIENVRPADQVADEPGWRKFIGRSAKAASHCR
ncbi:MAG: hypothetical protein SFT92_04410 [Rickettsiales bacterium]|nr:hypothetical protein [Rickettsiales bacterium]